MALIKKLAFGKQIQTIRPRGKFIVIDGTDGSGKATQTNLLLETLEAYEYPAEMVDFPQYDTKSSGPLEKYLSGKYGQVEPHPASILYAVDRFDASFKIRNHLDKGKIVVANRYVTSNAGHQGSKIDEEHERIQYFKWLDNLEYNIFKIPKPDLNIILHVPSDVAYELILQRSKEENRALDMHENDREHLKRAEEVYLSIAKLFPNTKLIECVEDGKLLSPDQIHNKVWELVRRIALKNSLPAMQETK